VGREALTPVQEETRMNLTKRNKIIIAAAALAGAAAVTGSAFTAGGLADNTTDNFIGGTRNQTITGAALENVDYDIATDNDINQVVVTLSGNVIGRRLEIEFYTAGSPPALTGSPYTCSTINASRISTCTAGATPAKSINVETVTFRVDN
jgi:hypothetical protein